MKLCNKRIHALHYVLGLRYLSSRRPLTTRALGITFAGMRVQHVQYTVSFYCLITASIFIVL